MMGFCALKLPFEVACCSATEGPKHVFDSICDVLATAHNHRALCLRVVFCRRPLRDVTLDVSQAVLPPCKQLAISSKQERYEQYQCKYRCIHCTTPIFSQSLCCCGRYCCARATYVRRCTKDSKRNSYTESRGLFAFTSFRQKLRSFAGKGREHTRVRYRENGSSVRLLWHVLPKNTMCRCVANLYILSP